MLFPRAMANHPDRLSAMLDMVDANSLMIMRAAEETPEVVDRDEVWWPYLVERFGDENAIFQRIRVDRRVFDLAFVFVQEVPVEHRGKKGAVRSNREKLLYLVVFWRKALRCWKTL